jgi:hypothetical protein
MESAFEEFHVHTPPPGAVIFTEIDPLPGPQNQAAGIDQNGSRRTGKGGFDVGRGVTFSVAVGFVGPDNLTQDHENIILHGRIGIFVDSDSGRSMGHINIADAVQRAVLVKEFLNAGGYINKLSAFGSFYLEGMNHNETLSLDLTFCLSEGFSG